MPGKYNQDYYAEHKQVILERSKNRNKLVAARRRALLSPFACIACGNNNPDVIQWHHVNPADKESQVIGNGISEEKFWNEVLKCVPLCANCHVLVHKNKLCLLQPKLK